MGAFTMSGEVHYQGQHGVAGPMAGSAVAQISAPQDETIRQLARIWQDLLGIPSVGLDQNYFDLGGDSPLAVQLFAQIEKVFKVKLPLATLFEAPTIQELGQILLLRADSPASGWSPRGFTPSFLLCSSTPRKCSDLPRSLEAPRI
jgi:acyl carrier protein